MNETLASTYQPVDPGYDKRVRASFARQKAMGLIGAKLTRVAPGGCEIELPYRPDLTQQHGFVHGGIVGMIADSAAGYAAFSLLPDDASLLTVEYKLNLLAPGKGDMLIACGEVIKSGRTLSVVKADVFAVNGTTRMHCAVMQQTLITLHGKADS
jgi:uncharacterized protein (TIGR00369 family)